MEGMSEIDFEKLAEIELRKDEAENADLEGSQVSFAAVSNGDAEISPTHPYYDVARHNILHLVGDDNLGRKVIAFSCCRLPPSYQLNHRRLLEYLKYALDQYVENDYTVVYFHYGLNSKNKPSLSWLQSAYKEFDRKYKKNLKALYIVHPTNFIKIIWNIFKPLISHKFGKKVIYLNYLSDLRDHLKYDQLKIPQEVIRHDENLHTKQKKKPLTAVKIPPPRPPLPTQQFGVSLQYLKAKNKGELIPPVMKHTVSYLKRKGVESSLRVMNCREIVHGLPEQNYAVLKFLICFLHMVSQESIFNKMTGSNLACVFGLNLIWSPKGTPSFSTLVPINIFIGLLIDFYPTIFSSRSVPGEQLP
ncbi:rho GTPase-activating protein 8 isoform X3 [Zootoca vivipara]|uniref:rho GTPase-activating protein 8 isoform X3 n=1 Tax=Zootoca vivipara TaxID=8524 RepID=UPI00293BAF74|nr:rho GTPase-activating protein 8 isoform X3 [Zootoca vivipara]